MTTTPDGGQEALVAEAGEVVPDWSQAPEWAMWWAVDANGDCCVYEKEPHKHSSLWATLTGQWLSVSHVEIPLGIDWRLLKMQRPQD